MFNNFKTLDSVNNLRLYSLVNQVRELAETNMRKNSKSILHLMKKILSLAKKEKKWYLYFETFRHVLYFLNENGNQIDIVQYSQVFFRDYITYFEKAIGQYSQEYLFRLVIQTYDEIFDAYKLFAQIDEEKWNRFWKYFEKAVTRCGNTFYYWRCRLEYAIMNRNVKMAQHAFTEFRKYSIDYRWHCYSCLQLVVIGYYILINDISQAEAISQQILSKNVQADAIEWLDICLRATPYRQYNYLLQFSIITANTEAFVYFLPRYMEIWHSIEYSTDTYVAYYRSAIGDFSGLEEEIEIAVEDAQKLYTFPSWESMEYMLCWTVYFQKLYHSGTYTIKILCETENFPKPNKKGYCSIEAVILWFETKADELGAEFEKNWKQFTYQPLKKSYFNCCGLPYPT